MQALEILSEDCQCKDIKDEEYRKKMRRDRDVFINELQSHTIRQRLLENNTLDLKTAFDQTNSLDIVHQNSLAYIRLPHLREDESTACKNNRILNC